MDTDRFDTLARSLTESGSRRRALATLLGGGLVPVLGRTDGEAKKKKKACGRCQIKKKGKCTQAPDDAPCATGRTCQGGACTCLPGTYFCESQTQETCCTTGQACNSGTCGACPATNAYCDFNTQLVCGIDSGTNGLCSCVTSVEGKTVCSNGFGQCQTQSCETDEECTALLREPAVCVMVVGTGCNNTPCLQQGTTVCIIARCP
jgi:hypothetical protein